MAVVQQEVLQAILKDPAVASAGAYIGAGIATPTENQGRVFITLKTQSQRPPIKQVMAQLNRDVGGISGVRRSRTSTSTAG